MDQEDIVEPQHSPLPWKAEPAVLNQGSFLIVDARGRNIATVWLTEDNLAHFERAFEGAKANAELIVAAVNKGAV